MSAGRGITHSEFNSSSSEGVHFLQIWIMPDHTGITPGYEQKRIDLSAARGRLHLIAADQGGPGAVSLHQDVSVSVAILESGEQFVHRLGDGKYAWLQLVRGSADVNGNTLNAGDGAAISSESEVSVGTSGQAEMLLFDIA